MRKTAFLIIAIAATFTATAQTEAEIRAQYREAMKAARAAYTNALAEIGITNATPKQTAGKGKTVLTKSQAAFFENRRIAVKRDTETLPGYVITTWYRNGKPDTKAPAIVTNALHRIIGREQKNPLQTLAERYRAAVVDATNRLAQISADYMSASNRAARAEARTVALVTWAEEQRDKAALPTTKAIYQAIIDKLEGK